MGLGDEVKKLKYDKRMIEFNVNRGILSKADADKFLNDLPDLASNVENLGLVKGGNSSPIAMQESDFGSEGEN